MSIEEMTETTLRELMARGDATWPGVGTFRVVRRPKRQGRNPQTGAEVPVAAKTGVLFRSSPALRERIQQAPAVDAPEEAGEVFTWPDAG